MISPMFYTFLGLGIALALYFINKAIKFVDDMTCLRNDYNFLDARITEIQERITKLEGMSKNA